MRKNSGFTLAELLIVVVIIAVLVGIIIPIFNVQLEQAREASDAANIRSQYAETMSEAITSDKNITGNKIHLSQKKSGWQTQQIRDSLSSLGVIEGEPGTQAWVSYDYKTKKIIIHFDGTNNDTAIENNILSGITSPDWDFTNNPDKITVSSDKVIMKSSTSKDVVLKFGGEGSDKKISLEKGQKYQLILEIEKCDAILTAKISSRKGNHDYLSETINKEGLTTFEYTATGKEDSDIRVSLTIFKNQDSNREVAIKSAALIKTN